jgi:predicted nucleotidyltransferase
MASSTAIPGFARRLPSGRVPRAAIRQYVEKVVERFQPQRVILFGSHAYGKPHVGSDVDLLVIMPSRRRVNLAGRIRWLIPTPFPMDLLVHPPEYVAKRLKLGDWFFRDIFEQGIVLHDAANASGSARPTLTG